MKKILFAAMAATVLFASCAKEDVNNVPEGESTKMGLSFSFPGATTRAIDDDNATLAETTITDVTVFIFDANGNPVAGTNDVGTYSAVNTKLIGDFTETDDNVYTLKETSKIATTTGARKIYVGMNLPASLKALATEAALKAELAIVMADLATAGTGMAMFSTEVAEKALVLDETLNMVEVTVERMVAKVAASYGSTLSTGAKTVDGVTYTVSKVGVGQDGTKMYPVKRFDGTKLFTPAGDNKESAPAKGNLKSIYAAGTTVPNMTDAIYAGEKSSPGNLRGEVAYAVFQAQFVPAQVATVEDSAIKLNSYSAGAASMWVVRSDEGVYFCQTEQDAKDIIDLGILTNVTKPQYYDKGYCYYYIYLNKNRTPEKYELHRNDFIHLEVSDIMGLGAPGKETDGEEPKPPTDPKLPVDNEPTTLRVEVTVSPWKYGKVTGVVLE